jgi:hypothetical protein
MFIFSVQSLGSRSEWQKKIAMLEKDITKAKADSRFLEYGIQTDKENSPSSLTPPHFEDGKFDLHEYEAFYQKIFYSLGQKENLIQLRNAVDLLIKDRDSRTWFSCIPGNITALTQPEQDPKQDVIREVTINVALTDNVTVTAIPPKTVIYLFDVRNIDDGGAYLGAFYLESVTPNGAVLKNSYLLTASEFERLNTSKAASPSWTAYTKLPGDHKGYFAGGKVTLDAEGRAVPPVAVAEETENAENSQDAASASLTFASSAEYRLYLLKRIKLQQYVDALNARLEKVNAAIEAAEEHLVYYEDTVIPRTKTELQEMNRQRNEVKELNDSLHRTIASLETEIELVKRDNKTKIAELTKAQLTAADIIHQKNAALVSQ